MFIQSSQNIDGLSAKTYLTMPCGYNLEDVGPDYFPSLGINDGSLAIDVDTNIPYYVGNNYWREILFTKFAVSHAWINTGNKLTDPTRNFIGTLDNAAFLISAGTGILSGPGATRFTINGQIETLGTGESVFLGEGAGINTIINTGVGNSFVGYQAGHLNTTGDFNTAYGRGSLLSNATGHANIAIGNDALSQNIVSYNTAVGSSSMKYNTSGAYNTVIGAESMKNNTIGNNNTAMGFQSMLSNANGYNNSAVGYDSLYSNVSGYGNTAMGFQSSYLNNSGYNNVALGFQSLYANILGYNNVALGFQASYLNYTGYNNTALGYFSLHNNIVGHTNIAIGYSAMANFTTGNGNIGIGANAGLNCTWTESNCIFIGAEGTTSQRGVSDRIEIGKEGVHKRSFFQGIFGNPPATGSNSVEVNAYGKLGTSATSLPYIDNIDDMGNRSYPIMGMRPIVFNYNETPSELEYGLLAEEVDNVFPEIVTRDINGNIYSVKYQYLPILLLNETIRQQNQMDLTDRILAGVQALLDITSALVEIHDIFLRILTGGIV